ncbi:MAG: T9SS type A sorting domain-containing protein [Bacteroidetes bacterium]|nr:T9SS type A sorting domain-containing protein [Bacteroidota bacterium]
MTTMLNMNCNSHQRIFIILILLCNSFISVQTNAQCNAIDQSQLNYNGGMSARNLPGYSEFQVFTAGTTGTLCQIEMGFFNPMSGTGIFNVYNGSGINGAILQTQQVTVTGSGNFFYAFPLSVSVTSGLVYTFQFIPIQGGGLPDPYGVQVENPGTYQGGELNIIDPSGTYPTGFDMVFKTYVTVSTNLVEAEELGTIVTVSPNPFSLETTLKTTSELRNGALEIVNELGALQSVVTGISGHEIPLSRNNLPAGIYFIRLTDENKLYEIEKLVVTD